MTEATPPGQPLPPKPYNGERVVLSVPRAHVKAVKLVLEKHKLFDRHHGISAEEKDASTEPRMRVHTTIPCSQDELERVSDIKEAQWLKDLQLCDISTAITFSSWNPSASTTPLALNHNPLRKALGEALEALPPSALASLNTPIDALVASFPESYSVYTPLLLLPSTSLPSIWTTLLASHAADLTPVWAHIATALQCTHIALNSPIPPSNTPSSAHARDAANILRSPVHLAPIYGNFGAAPTAQTLASPNAEDFATALWVRTTQNGIHQTWAPLYTMFSRGNVKEKARILSLPSLPRNSPTSSLTTTTTTTPSLAHPNPDISAVDMYAGIGYFSFSYARGGAKRVLAWELNPWSIEGLRRGCALNGWKSRVFTASDMPGPEAGDHEWEVWGAGVVARDEEFWIFAMSNEIAGLVVRVLRDGIPPVRHVNLGLLPLSRGSWRGAVGAVDARLGGWVHAHENVGVGELDERRGEVEREFQRLADECGGAGARRKGVRVQHVERVKMYAPGVVHAVFDVYIPGTQEADQDTK